MKIFSKDVFEFRKTRVVCGNEGVGVRFMDVLVAPDGMGYLMEITSGKKGFG